MSTLVVLIYVRIFFFANFCRFRKIKYTQNFLLNSIHKNKYTLNMRKIHISRNARKIHAQN